jgi:protein regulator of cytokinesis 1
MQPVFTPRETPRGSQGIVLLSPSRTITESLNALASSTAQQLESIWDEVGYNPQERASQLSDLLVKFRDQCEQKISEEHGVAETFRQTIADAKEELKTTGESLKATIDPALLQENSGMTLTDELSNLEATLEGLRADAETAKEDMKECQEYLIESHLTLGIDLDQQWNNVETDLTIGRRQQFHQKVEEMKQEVATRTSTIIQLLRDCQHLMNDLAIDAQASESSLDKRIAGSLARSKDSSFIMASKFETESCTGISAKALESLSDRASQLSGEKRRRKNALQEMGAEIAMLWEQLRIPEAEQQAFSESVKGLGMETLKKGEQELSRLNDLKGEMLGTLIDEARETIRSLWVDTNATESLEQEFNGMDVTDQALYNDELLDKHEEYVHVLQERLDQMKPIMQVIERREEILRQRTEYEELQKDSSRLNQRGAAMAKQLMEEEKMARRIKKELPKLTTLLTEKLAEWKETNKEEFQYQGEIYRDVMKHQDDEWTQHKEDETQMKRKKKQEQQKFDENKFLGKSGPSKNNETKRTSGQNSKPGLAKRQPLGNKNRS